jgi:Family of unknown function (DUF5996)
VTSTDTASTDFRWPALPLREWLDTYATLHMWAQIVGKVRLALSPPLNHWWEVALYVNGRGLTTSPVPYPNGIFEVQFDFVGHKLLIETSGGESRSLALRPQSVADFYAEFMSLLESLDIKAHIWHMPVEIPDRIPFDADRVHASYDPEYANRLFRILASVDTVLKQFRGRFIGKSSPVHFFWGSFDLAATRFSGRRAPARPGADVITRAAYSHEVSSAGFWPGGGLISDAAFYAYAAPEPPGFAASVILPGAAYYHTEMREFILMYDEVRRADSPEEMLLGFLQSTYEADADGGNWDRASLEPGSDSAPPAARGRR